MKVVYTNHHHIGTMRHNANMFVGHRIMLNLEYCIIVRFLLDISFFSFNLTAVWEGMSTAVNNNKKNKHKKNPANSKVGGT